MSVGSGAIQDKEGIVLELDKKSMLIWLENRYLKNVEEGETDKAQVYWHVYAVVASGSFDILEEQTNDAEGHQPTESA